MTSHTHPHPRLEGTTAVVLTLVGWSSVPLFLKLFTDDIDAWTSNGWRYTFAAFIWAPVVILGLARRSLPERIWRRALLPSLFNCAGQVCFTEAHYHIDPGLLTFALRFQIVFVAIGALLFFPSERRAVRSPGFLLGNALVIGGTLGAVSVGPQILEGSSALGVGLSIASGLFFAAYGLSVRGCMQGVRPLVAFSVISQYTAAGMLGLMLLFAEDYGAGAMRMSALDFSLLLASAVIGIALGHVGFYTSIARLGVAVTSGVLQLQPFLAAIGSMMLFGERLTWPQWIAGCIAVLGALLVLRAEDKVSRRAISPSD